MTCNVIGTSYKITITRIETTEATEQDYKLLEKRPLTDTELEKEHRYLMHTGESDKISAMKEIYGYTERFKNKVETTATTIYEQIMDGVEIKINDLVAHINKGGNRY